MPDATERKVLIACALAAGLLCTFPRIWMTAIGLWSLGVILAGVHWVALRREAKQQKPAALPSPPASPPEAQGAVAETPPGSASS